MGNRYDCPGGSSHLYGLNVPERTVNQRQLEVLTWIVAGCPPGVMEGVTHKATAVALQNRRLATVTKKKGVWRAEATAAGRHFAAHGEYPDGHWRHALKTATSDAVPRVNISVSSDQTSPQLPNDLPSPAPTSAVGRRVTGLRPVEQMIADVVAAGGSLDVSDPNSYYEKLVRSAVRFNKVPDGKLLTLVQRKGWGQKTLKLDDKPDWMTESRAPITVMDRLVKPHPSVVTLRGDKTRMPFRPATRVRALRLLAAVAKEADARGYTVTCPSRSQQHTYRQQRQNEPGDLLITIGVHPYALHVSEDPDRVPHVPTAKELHDFEARGYPRIPKYDRVPSDRLTITINGGVPARQSAFSDTKTIDLGDRLPQLLQELELRAAVSEERRVQAEREAEQRREAWEAVRVEAVVAVRETHRATILIEQAERWRRTRLLNDYIEAMAQHVDAIEGDERADAEAWLAWSVEHADRINPLRPGLRMPPDPEITAEALKPHMKGHSP